MRKSIFKKINGKSVVLHILQISLSSFRGDQGLSCLLLQSRCVAAGGEARACVLLEGSLEPPGLLEARSAFSCAASRFPVALASHLGRT